MTSTATACGFTYEEMERPPAAPNWYEYVHVLPVSVTASRLPVPVFEDLPRLVFGDRDSVSVVMEVKPDGTVHGQFPSRYNRALVILGTRKRYTVTTAASKTKTGREWNAEQSPLLPHGLQLDDIFIS